MKKKVFRAISIATSRRYLGPCWWQIPTINKKVEHAVKMGWANRWSVTQVEWREAGILEARKNGFC